MKILLLSAYDALSHQYWWQGLKTALSDVDWTVLTLPARNYSWRIRGNSLSYATEFKQPLNNEYDLIICTSMVDLSSLRGLVPALSKIPTIVYFHENQFAYPRSQRAHVSLEAQVCSIYSAMCADYLIFNSEFNRNTFVNGVGIFIDKMPDCVPKNLAIDLHEKSCVLPVPLHDDLYERRIFENKERALRIVWNHRWEYDKAPEIFFQALEIVQSRKYHFQLNVLGQQFRNSPPVFEQSYQQFKENILQWGMIEDRHEYLACLSNSDVVVSTAQHDFQGLAIFEAVASGCVPVLPDRLAYPEYFDDNYIYSSSRNDYDEAQSLAQRLINLINLHAQQQLPKAPDIRAFTWNALQGRYRNVMQHVCEKFITN